ncbi:nocturnin isoform X1 [Neocloeon triangulifer]|uniref:nocturnin isoform X1 n=2 Tax=Neocloeon triangulifer TaxID=2078957 RepID=UPI00286F0213|nr:nocturnin isoform X1 [Neocloeon triangulifer]
MAQLREALALAEQLAAGAVVSPASKRRFQRLTHQPAPDPAAPTFVPPKQLLLYLVRMGSFTSAPKILNQDLQDNEVHFPERLSRDQLLERCRREQRHLPVKRAFRPCNNALTAANGHQDGVRVLRWNVVSRRCGDATNSPHHLRVLQWNILSQALGEMNDNFACCPDEALQWPARRYQIVEEIIEYCPDIICLQEVDHFKFLSGALASQGYSGMFFPKPDSPCLYIQGNNGPDGCAIFFRTDKFDLLNNDSRVLEVWSVQSNQVALLINLRIKETGREVCVATTHLKARNGALLSTLREEQGKDLLRFLEERRDGRPLVLCGDFNAEPTEPVYRSITAHPSELGSAYAEAHHGREPPYTTWKVREGEGEVCHTIDYVFFSQREFAVDAVLDFPTGEEIGLGRIPSFIYPSDHFSLVCDLSFRDQRGL